MHMIEPRVKVPVLVVSLLPLPVLPESRRATVVAPVCLAQREPHGTCVQCRSAATSYISVCCFAQCRLKRMVDCSQDIQHDLSFLLGFWGASLIGQSGWFMV
ncbi:hypothetical protein C8R48DRAFT_3536 [Suillus tomentosus]|nr:hypothetical protein C8R48DRAFT_3536 [Suillus tomentosus]